jgi:hypothetical protein
MERTWEKLILARNKNKSKSSVGSTSPFTVTV